MRIGIYPGSFDPVTLGHLDIIERASRMVDTLIIGVLVNGAKSPMFTTEERVELIKKVTKHLPNVEVVLHQGMMTDFCKAVNADVMIKSIRNTADLQQVLDIADVNREYWDGETCFVVGAPQYQHVSSSLVRELVGLNQDITNFVPAGLAEEITKLLKN